MKFVKMALLIVYNFINCITGAYLGVLLGYPVLPLRSDPLWLCKLIAIGFFVNVVISMVLRKPKGIIGSVVNPSIVAFLFITVISAAAFVTFLFIGKPNFYLLGYSLIFGSLFFFSLKLIKRFKKSLR